MDRWDHRPQALNKEQWLWSDLTLQMVTGLPKRKQESMYDYSDVCNTKMRDKESTAVWHYTTCTLQELGDYRKNSGLRDHRFSVCNKNSIHYLQVVCALTKSICRSISFSLCSFSLASCCNLGSHLFAFVCLCAKIDFCLDMWSWFIIIKLMK